MKNKTIGTSDIVADPAVSRWKLTTSPITTDNTAMSDAVVV